MSIHNSVVDSEMLSPRGCISVSVRIWVWLFVRNLWTGDLGVLSSQAPFSLTVRAGSHPDALTIRFSVRDQQPGTDLQSACHDWTREQTKAPKLGVCKTQCIGTCWSCQQNWESFWQDFPTDGKKFRKVFDDRKAKSFCHLRWSIDHIFEYFFGNLPNEVLTRKKHQLTYV